MSFNGVWVWNDKYGIPENDDTRKKIFAELSGQKEKSPNFKAFVQFFSDFIAEASEGNARSNKGRCSSEEISGHANSALAKGAKEVFRKP